MVALSKAQLMVKQALGVLEWLSVGKPRVNGLLCQLLVQGCGAHTPHTGSSCTNALVSERLQACSSVLCDWGAFFRILFKNTQELSNFLYMVPLPKPTEVTGKTPTGFSWHSDLSRVPYGLGYCECLWGCVTISVLLEGLSCCTSVTME